RRLVSSSDQFADLAIASQKKKIEKKTTLLEEQKSERAQTFVLSSVQNCFLKPTAFLRRPPTNRSVPPIDGILGIDRELIRGTTWLTSFMPLPGPCPSCRGRK
ncbi:hypothetical protein DAPPUDRAFT_279435, partial [Daphnia pulex]